MNIVLDLDGTLIHCPEDIATLSPRCFNLRHHHIFLDGELHLIFERPFLGQFLRALRGRRIAVWTAADKSYADFIVHHILEPHLLPDQRFEFVWARQQCKESETKYKVLKSLTFLAEKRRDFARASTIIVDDNDELLTQDNKVYVIPEFTCGKLDDTELLKVLETINV